MAAVQEQEHEEKPLEVESSRSPQEEKQALDSDEHDDELSRTNSKPLAETLSPFREALFVAVICLAQFCTQVGLAQCLALIHVIGDHFGLQNPGELSWLIAAYSLTVGTFILIAGRLGDLFGYKLMWMIGFVWFAVWSMVAGLAVYSNHVLFDFARVFQGIGPAMVLPNGLAILGAAYPPSPRKSMVFALFGACAPGGASVGATFAGLFNLAWWPWTFWSFAIALCAVALTGFFVIPEPPPSAMRRLPIGQKLRQLDARGCLTGVTALVLVNFAWNQAGVVGWQEAYVYVCLILGLICFGCFVFVEVRLAQYPLIPFKAFSSDVIFVLACVSAGWATFGIWVYYFWQFNLQLRRLSPLLASAYICPVAVSGAIASVITGFLLGRLKAAWVMVCALTMFLVGIILIATCPVDQIYWAQTFMSAVITPWGMDMSFPAGTLILSNAVSKEHQGIAASLVNTIVNYSISIGLGLAGTVEGHVNDGGKDVLKGFRGAWYLGIGISAAGVATSLVFVARSYQRERRGGSGTQK